MQKQSATLAAPVAIDSATVEIEVATIHDLAQPHPEEGCGGYDSALKLEARQEYQRALQFAGLQLRARALQERVWADYRRAQDAIETLDAVFDAPEITNEIEPRNAILREQQRHQEMSNFAFRTWSEITAIAYAEGRDAVSDEVAEKGAQAVMRVEERDADNLLDLQRKLQRSRARVEDDEDPFGDE